MAENTQVEFQKVQTEGIFPPPDDLIAGNLGVVYTDLIKLTSAGEFKRGTLLMSNSDGYTISTLDGVKSADEVCILCDDVTIADSEFAEVSAYFEGEFNDARVILPFEGEDDNHAELIEAVRATLRGHKIFLRKLHK